MKALKLVTLLGLGLSLLVLGGCNTVNGFGKDVQRVGQAVEGASSKK